MKVEQTRKLKIMCCILAVALVFGLTALLGMHLLNEYTLEITLNGDAELTLEYGQDYTELSAHAKYYGSIFHREAVSVEVTVSGLVDTDTVGTYELRYHAEYEELSSEAQRLVHVVDTTSPEIVLQGGDG